MVSQNQHQSCRSNPWPSHCSPVVGTTPPGLDKKTAMALDQSSLQSFLRERESLLLLWCRSQDEGKIDRLDLVVEPILSSLFSEKCVLTVSVVFFAKSESWSLRQWKNHDHLGCWGCQKLGESSQVWPLELGLRTMVVNVYLGYPWIQSVEKARKNGLTHVETDENTSKLECFRPCSKVDPFSASRANWLGAPAFAQTPHAAGQHLRPALEKKRGIKCSYPTQLCYTLVHLHTCTYIYIHLHAFTCIYILLLSSTNPIKVHPNVLLGPQNEEWLMTSWSQVVYHWHWKTNIVPYRPHYPICVGWIDIIPTTKCPCLLIMYEYMYHI